MADLLPKGSANHARSARGFARRSHDRSL